MDDFNVDDLINEVRSELGIDDPLLRFIPLKAQPYYRAWRDFDRRLIESERIVNKLYTTRNTLRRALREIATIGEALAAIPASEPQLRDVLSDLAKNALLVKLSLNTMGSLRFHADMNPIKRLVYQTAKTAIRFSALLFMLETDPDTRKSKLHWFSVESLRSAASEADDLFDRFSRITRTIDETIEGLITTLIALDVVSIDWRGTYTAVDWAKIDKVSAPLRERLAELCDVGLINLPISMADVAAGRLTTEMITYVYELSSKGELDLAELRAAADKNDVISLIKRLWADREKRS